MTKLISLLTLIFGLTFPAHAKEWRVDLENSKLGFFALQAGAEFEGRFKTFSSTVVFDPENLAQSQVRIVIDIASVDTQNAERDAQIVLPEWFDVPNHPEAVFETTSIVPDGDGFKGEATLTIRGVTKDVVLPFDVTITGDAASAKGELSVSRLEYGIGQGQWVATNMVGDGVRIFFDLKASGS